MMIMHVREIPTVWEGCFLLEDATAVDEHIARVDKRCPARQVLHTDVPTPFFSVPCSMQNLMLKMEVS